MGVLEELRKKKTKLIKVRNQKIERLQKEKEESNNLTIIKIIINEIKNQKHTDSEIIEILKRYYPLSYSAKNNKEIIRCRSKMNRGLLPSHGFSKPIKKKFKQIIEKNKS